MEYKYIFVVFLLSCTIASMNCASIKNQQDDEAFVRFLKTSLQNYTQWIKENRFDPSPSVPEFKDLSSATPALNISCVISNFWVGGLSQSWYPPGLEVEGSLAQQRFLVAYQWNQNITIGGDYVASGMLLQPNISLSASGKFQIVLPGIVQYFQRGFEITPEGFIDISKVGDIWEMFTLSLGVSRNCHFDGLLSGEAIEYETVVCSQFALQLGRLLDTNFDMSGFPGGDIYLAFFTELFSKTPIADIINQ